MINDLFCDIINQGNTATFIDNIIVATEIEEKYDKIVEEVLKWLKENDFFMKLEKVLAKGKGGGVFGSSNRTKGSRNTER